MRCRELMERNVISCREDTTVADLAKLMRVHEIGIVPVCDADGRVVGTVTDRDLVVRGVARGLDAASGTARDVMSGTPITCHPDETISVAENLMVRHKLGRILCVESDGRLAGIVSIADAAQVEPEERTGRVFRAITSRETSFVLW